LLQFSTQGRCGGICDECKWHGWVEVCQ
jgi:hypothetical protein